MLVSGIQKLNFKNVITKNNSQKSNNVNYRFNNTGLVSDTISFGNKSSGNPLEDFNALDYSMAKFEENWDDDATKAYNILKKSKPSKEELKKTMSSMEEHFNGILKVLETNPVKNRSNWNIDESAIDANILYKKCAKKLTKRPQVINKLDTNLAKFLNAGHTLSVSPVCLIDWSHELKFNDDIITELMAIEENDACLIKIKEMPDKINEVFIKILQEKGRIPASRFEKFPEDTEDKLSENDAEIIDKSVNQKGKNTIVDEAENLLKEREYTITHAVDEISYNKPETIKEGFKALVKVDGIPEMKGILSDFITQVHKLPNELKLNSLAFDIGTMFKGKENSLTRLIETGNFPEAFQKALKGGFKF